ncbi:hypothetical protein [Mycolicibacterium nivoides]|uniref:Uncharacterized protein n=1 Tax=Mycolicibacterium nivoides TaxID=2487344 RepID=A0ABW9LF52_9MYCO
MDDGSYETVDQLADSSGDPIGALVEALRLAFGNGAAENELTDQQKRVLAQFLAIRNGHGDFGPSRNLQAFFDSPELLIPTTNTPATLTFRKLPDGTRRLIARSKDGTGKDKEIVKDFTTDPTLPYEIPNIPKDEALRGLLTESQDAKKVILGIAFPKRV